MENDTLHLELVTTFLARARELSQWRENLDVLAPGERTLYMEKAEFAALSLLAEELPGAQMLVVQCDSAKSDIGNLTGRRYREWLISWQGQSFQMEGVVSENEAKRQLVRRWLLRGSDPDEQLGDVYIQPQCDTPMGMGSSDPVMARLLEMLRAPLAELVSGPMLDNATVPSSINGRTRRF